MIEWELKAVFAPDAFNAPAELYARLQMQRRGFEHESVTEDPKIHERVLTIQQAVLDHLLHPIVLKRVSDTRLYGNEYPLVELMRDLTNAVFAADQKRDIRPGLVADLIAVMGNPLEDPTTLKQVFFVLKEGELMRHDR